MFDLKIIGNTCKRYRLSLGYYQKHIAQDLGYSVENISSFEAGRNDNSKILLWYMLHGLKVSDIMEGLHEEK